MPKKPKQPSLTELCLIPEDPAQASGGRELCQKCGLFKACQRCGHPTEVHSLEHKRCPDDAGNFTPLKTPFMQPYIPKGWTGEYLFVGEAPGRDEDKLGRPFVGAAGQEAAKLCQEAGLRREQVAWTNGNRCRPFRNATPSMTQIRCCRPFLLYDLNSLNPKTVLALGNSALKALTNDGQATVTRYRGRPLDTPQKEEKQ